MPPRPTTNKIAAVRKDRKITVPLWEGPLATGVSASKLKQYFTCQERFRITQILGIKEEDKFEPRVEYGQLWHACEEGVSIHGFSKKGTDHWMQPLNDYVSGLMKRYPLERNNILRMKAICKLQFEVYLEVHKKTDTSIKRKEIYSEEKFSQPILLPSGRTVNVTGIWDSVDKVDGLVWIQDNKTKSKFDYEQLMKQLNFDLQMMMYVVSLKEKHPEFKVGGIRYNLVRRPLAGGKHTIQQRKEKVYKKKTVLGETNEQFFARLQGLIRGDAAYFFDRLIVHINQSDVDKFKSTCLFPVLENLLDDYEWWDWSLRNNVSSFDYVRRSHEFPRHQRRHFRTPFGIYNTLADGGSTPLDHYLDTGSMVGLVVKRR